MELLSKPWPWYVTGPLIGLTIPILLILGNKSFGISSSLRHICAACIPAGIGFFKYNWKKEVWNLFFVAGIVIGGFVTVRFINSYTQVAVNEKLQHELANYNIHDMSLSVPGDIFTLGNMMTVKGFLLVVAGGFLVGFGTRYANGCTSGHSIMGISNLQWASVIATCCFMAGGIIMANFILPYILSL